MWLFNSSVGRKLVMSVSGIALVLFLVFHLAMNTVAVFSADAYNTICALLGANWYAVAMSIGLAGLFAVHIGYALWLSHKNWRARGAQRYEYSERPKGVSWASQNMLVLGAIVLLFFLLHLSQFWHKMMFAELTGHHGPFDPANGAAFIDFYFKGHFFTMLGYQCSPRKDAPRGDIITAIQLGTPEKLCAFCRGIQQASPVDSFVTPEPWAMPGYDDPVIMAAGSFIQGSSIELSADGPVRPPYDVFMQGGLTYESGKLGILMAVEELLAE